MDLTKLSKPAQKLVKTNTGYRCLDQVNDEYHKPVDVFDFEINELGNSDISDTIKDLYGIDTNNETKQIDQFVKRILNTDFYHIRWLASDPLDAVEYYSDFHQRFNTLDDAKHDDGSPIPVRKYVLPADYIILSDIGSDGQLIAWPDGEYLLTKKIN